MSNHHNVKHLCTYGRRLGRPIKPSKKGLMESLYPLVGLNIDTAVQDIDPSILFDQAGPIWFESGFGGGEHLAALAELYPDINFIGCEPFLNGVVSLLGHINEKTITNIRLFQGNSLDILAHLKNDSLSRFYLMFPDPWPKQRHHKRRFIQPVILNLLWDKLKLGAELRIATDHQDYQRWILHHLEDRKDFTKVIVSFEKPTDWPSTRYEMKAMMDGRPSQYFIFKKT